jgi:integrase
VNDCIERQAPLDVRRIKQEAWGEQTEAGTPFLDWVAVTIPTIDIKEGTRKHYNTTLARLREYGRMRTWGDLTSEGILAFDRWLHSLKINQSDAAKKMGKNESLLSDAAVYNYHKNMKGLIRRALFEGKITANPYERLRGQLKRGEKESVEYLTEDEVAAFMSLAPVAGTAMAVARDLFVFQLFTGFGFTDMQSFDIKNYKRVDGKWISVVPRTKTGVATISQLLPPAVEVLERYGMKLPKMNNADYNHALKALGMAAGISTPLHSHLARHTFATFMLKNGVKVENLARMMGHRRITQTMRYAKVLAQSVHEDFDMIETILTNKQNEKVPIYLAADADGMPAG